MTAAKQAAVTSVSFSVAFYGTDDELCSMSRNADAVNAFWCAIMLQGFSWILYLKTRFILTLRNIVFLTKMVNY